MSEARLASMPAQLAGDARGIRDLFHRERVPGAKGRAQRGGAFTAGRD